MKSTNAIHFKTSGFVLSLLLIGLFVSSCAGDTTPVQEPVENQALTFEQEVSASGEVVPVNWITLSYPTGGENLDLKVTAGDQVTRNQILVTNNDSRLMAGLHQAMAGLERAQFAYDQVRRLPTNAAVEAAKAALANAEANLDRLEDLSASDLAIAAAEADVRAARANLQLVRDGASNREIEAALMDLRAAEFALKQAEDAFDLRAPFDGTIVQVLAKPGEPVSAFQPVLILADLSELQVITTDLSEVDVARLKVGQTATIFFDALSEQTFSGTIIRIADKSSGVTSVYYEVTLDLNQVPEGLRWGMTTFIVIPVE